MNVYVYQAALWCESCGAKIWDDTPKPKGFDNNNESSWDSDDFPKGPYSDGGGEADCPQHCDGCGVHLENPLTSDGESYVKDKVKDGKGNAEVLDTWRENYSYLFEESDNDQ